MVDTTWRDGREPQPTIARFRQRFDREPTPIELARFQSAHHAHALGAPARIRRAAAKADHATLSEPLPTESLPTESVSVELGGVTAVTLRARRRWAAAALRQHRAVNGVCAACTSAESVAAWPCLAARAATIYLGRPEWAVDAETHGRLLPVTGSWADVRDCG
jgi:hypothetical protein